MEGGGGDRGGFGRGRGGDRGGDRGRGDRGRGRGRGDRGRGRGRGRDGDSDEWVPCTKLGRLCKDGKIKSLEDIFLFSMRIAEYQIIDHFCGQKIKDEVMCIKPVSKQTSAGQKLRFKAYVVVGDQEGHIGLGSKCAKEVATSIRGGIISAKMNLVPVRLGYWGKNYGSPHTIANNLTGKCGSVRVRLIPAPRGTGLVAAPASKKVLIMAGLDDCYSSSRGHTRSMGNFVQAVFFALRASYGYLSPNLWEPTQFTMPPFQEHTDHLKNTAKKV